MMMLVYSLQTIQKRAKACRKTGPGVGMRAEGFFRLAVLLTFAAKVKVRPQRQRLKR
jgi:hypothetical protein